MMLMFVLVVCQFRRWTRETQPLESGRIGWEWSPWQQRSSPGDARPGPRTRRRHRCGRLRATRGSIIGWRRRERESDTRTTPRRHEYFIPPKDERIQQSSRP